MWEGVPVGGVGGLCETVALGQVKVGAGGGDQGVLFVACGLWRLLVGRSWDAHLAVDAKV